MAFFLGIFFAAIIRLGWYLIVDAVSPEKIWEADTNRRVGMGMLITVSGLMLPLMVIMWITHWDRLAAKERIARIECVTNHPVCMSE